MPTESRTLEIVSTMRDFTSRTIRAMGRTFARTIRFSFVAPLRLFRGSLRAVRSSLSAVAAAALAAFAFVRGGQLARSLIDGADAMSKLARSTDSTAEDIQTLEVAFSHAGLSAEQFGQSIRALSRARSQALREGSGTRFDAFAGLGIDIEELRQLNPVELFREMAGELEQYGNVQERATLLQGIFEDNFLRLLELVGQGTTAFDALIERSERYGGIVSSETAKNAENLVDLFTDLERTLRGIGTTAVVGAFTKMAPAIQALLDFLVDNKGGLIRAFERMTFVLVDFIALLAIALARTVEFLSSGLAPLFNLIQRGLNAFSEIEVFGNRVFTLGDSEQLFGDALIENLTGGGGGVNPRLVAAVQAWTREQTPALYDAMQDEIARNAAEGGQTPLFVELLTGGSGFGEIDLSEFVEGINAFRENLRTGFREGSEEGENLLNVLGQVRTMLGLIAEEQEKSKGDMEQFFAAIGRGWETAIAQFRDFYGAVQAGTEQLLLGTFDNFANALTDIATGTKTVKEAFSDMAKFIIQDLIRITIRLLLIRALSSAFGGSLATGVGAGANATLLADGGVMQGQMGRPVPIKRYQYGGIARTPQLAVFGEGSGSEAFVPLLNGAIPVAIQGGGAGGTTVNLTIHSPDARGVEQFFQDNRHLLGQVFRHELVHNKELIQSVRSAR